MNPAEAGGLIRRLKSKPSIRALIAEFFPGADATNFIEFTAFLLAFDSISQTLDDFAKGPRSRFYAKSIDWINESEAPLPFDRACGQLELNPRQARQIIADMFLGLEARGPLRIVRPIQGATA
ncbi:MAG: hypothetical protein Q7J45_00845 [bacterium]|nr:hypothetical protein [bacterium]